MIIWCLIYQTCLYMHLLALAIFLADTPLFHIIPHFSAYLPEKMKKSPFSFILIRPTSAATASRKMAMILPTICFYYEYNFISTLY